jgi:hypothetical protein
VCKTNKHCFMSLLGSFDPPSQGPPWGHGDGFDERYVPLLCQANLLAIAEIVHRGMPVFNTMTITAMVDRWRPETHSFHLPCGEMTVTLEDMAMILGLPIRGRPVTGRVDSARWCERVVVFVGREPLARVPGVKG